MEKYNFNLDYKFFTMPRPLRNKEITKYTYTLLFPESIVN